MQDELERLRVWHTVLNRVFDNRLLFPALSRPRRILDCGYGTASWAIDVAMQNPGCEVLPPFFTFQHNLNAALCALRKRWKNKNIKPIQDIEPGRLGGVFTHMR